LKEEQIGKWKAIQFVAKRLLKLKHDLDMELFKICCERKDKVRIVIMLDGSDETSPSYKEKAIGLLQAVRQTAVEQLWVTTRPHLRTELDDEPQQLSYKVGQFSEKDQVEFLTTIWIIKDWSTEMNSKEKEEREKQVKKLC
jgi:hypothetical protein